MITLGFTGTRAFTREHLSKIEPLMWEWFKNYDTFVTGGCRGFDAVIGETLTDLLPDREHVVVIPSNLSQVDPWWLKRRRKVNVQLVQMPEGTTYRDRNLEIVKRSLALFYAASEPEFHPSQHRSGTWQTVRLAEKQHLPLLGVILTPSLIEDS